MRLIAKKGFFGKLFLFLFIIIVIAVIFIFTTKGYLVYNLIVGNDISVSLSSDQSYLSVQKGISVPVVFNAKITANPFCSVECSYSFRDLSSSKEIDSSTFQMKLLEPISKEYNIIENREGVGQSLYIFNMQCKGIKSTFCHTSGDLRGRSILIAVDYNLSSEEQAVKSSTKSSLSNLITKEKEISSYVLLFSQLRPSLIQIMSASYLDEKSLSVSSYLMQLNSHINKSLSLWDEWKISEIQQEIALAQVSLFSLESEVSKLNSSISGNVSLYNSAIDSLYLIRSSLNSYSAQTFPIQTSEKIERYASEFNTIVDSINTATPYSLSNKTLSLSKKLADLTLSSGTSENSSELSVPSFSLKSINASKILLSPINYSLELSIPEPAPICCISGKCAKCCDSLCRSDSSKFPVIFIHGHDFSSGVSAEYSLDVFERIQNSFESEGYLNAGPLLIGSSSSDSIWSKSSSPVAIRASYYFDILKNEGSVRTIQTKTDNIDTYALRLRDIINTVKAETNRDKVIIVAHSMGGLVARRYIDIFGESDVYKLVMIGTPNHGISGTTLKYCSVLGAASECSDMDETSLFINKLNNAKPLSIPVYNIIGIGCDTDGVDGDGIVKNSSAYFSSAKNYYVSGVCGSSFSYLHNELIAPSKYPEVYSIINSSIRDLNSLPPPIVL